MESEKRFRPNFEKPLVLYHASSRSDVEVFEPRQEKRRDDTEGPQIFATPSKAMATLFLVSTDDSWVKSGAVDGEPYIIISDEERFRTLDKGGTIYSLPSNTFKSDPEKGLRELEYTSPESVKPIARESFPSALDAMLEHNVKVYFIDKHTFEQIQNSPDHGESIVKSLKPLAKSRI